MSRRDGINIAEIIDKCKDLKDTYNRLKKSSAPLEEQIKEYAMKHPDEKLVSDNWEAKVTIIPKEEFDEEKAIEILKGLVEEKKLSGNKLRKVIKKKEYIDEDALEKLIYTGDLSAELLIPCKVEKDPTIRLTIGKRKE